MSNEQGLEGLSHEELLEKYEVERRLMSPQEAIVFTEYFVHTVLCAVTSAAESDIGRQVIEENWPEGLPLIHLPFLIDSLLSEDFLLEVING